MGKGVEIFWNSRKEKIEKYCKELLEFLNITENIEGLFFRNVRKIAT